VLDIARRLPYFCATVCSSPRRCRPARGA